MRTNKDAYQSPESLLVRVWPEGSVLTTLSSQGVSLNGAGVNEDNADDYGNGIW